MSKKTHKTVGILSFQGGVIEHEQIIESLGYNSIKVRSTKDLDNCDGLILPGGESTTIGFFLEESGLKQILQKKAKIGFPMWGTCAGAIILAKNIHADIIPPHLGIMDIQIARNAYGRQISSFTASITIPKLEIKSLNAAFIRAPIIEKVTGNAEILAFHGNDIVLVRQGNILASTFHPELVNDGQLHKYFISTL